ncbi:MAG: PEP/pyruvate-binding domain-containing protein, partial [bacterium]|nr:PEP/pyruvate-binding domain-containing protein [bacterium]
RNGGRAKGDFWFPKSTNLWDYVKTMLVKPFSQISKNDAATAGGKGASLGEMSQAGISVPPGFVILANAFEQFLEETDLNVEIDTILHSVDHKEMHTVENASRKIQALILGAKMPEDIATTVKKFYKELDAQYVAVRSSATAEDSASAAWAGQLDSFLNTTEETLLTNIQKCWASLFTPRAIFYRFEKELHKQKISVAVVVQKMVQSEVSGIAFSVHPVTEDRNQLIIEAGFGLGEAIVSGSVTPDSYVVEKEPRRIIDTNVSTQTSALYRVDSGGNEWKDIPEPKASSQVLNETQILELSELILRIESHYGFPCDIEWAYEREKFYITQSRPITTLSKSGMIRIPNSKSPFGSINEWQRLFRVQGLRFLIDDIWMGHYKTLDALTIIINDEYTSYLPHNVMERTLADGTDLISNPENFERYETEFRNYMKEVQSYAASFAFDSVSKEETGHLLNEFARLFYYYSKTEFFSTDGAYKLFEETKDKGLEKRLEQMGQIKNAGRSFLNSIFFGTDAVLPKLLKNLEQRFGVSERVLQQYSREEVLGLFDDKQVSNEEIERRNDSFYILGRDGSTVIKTGSEAREDIQEFIGDATREHSATITGTSAHSGKVRGTARIIRAGYDNFDTLHQLMDTVQKGDILVAETTSPELMPACQKAGGIITDQGGMLSHAAIVSRELNIPCIVGTSNATEVIKDGDLVEVDADNGIIKIIAHNA